jgi:hypothetical protein
VLKKGLALLYPATGFASLPEFIDQQKVPAHGANLDEPEWFTHN